MSVNYSKASAEAHKLVSKLHLETPPVNPLDVAEFLGVKVSEMKMPEKFKEVSGFLDFKRNEIVVNKEDSARRQAFTIAHELGHYVLHATKFVSDPDFYNVLFRTSGFDGDSAEEREANMFAASLLAPKPMLRIYKDLPLDVKAKVFGVSPLLLKYRKNI